jgi:hypothetical protein
VDIKTLGDRIEIMETLALWGRILDTRAYDLLSKVFAPDVVYDFGEGTIDRSLTELRNRIEAHHLRPNSLVGATQHDFTNHVITFDGDEAESVVNVFAAHEGLGPYRGQVLSQWLTYRDQWIRQSDGWRISHRTYRIAFSHGPMEIMYTAAPDFWQDGDSRRVSR